MSFSECPRCGEFAYETLESLSHCVDCNYTPEYEYEIAREYHDEKTLIAFRAARRLIEAA